MNETPPDHITPAIEALIGAESPSVIVHHAVEQSEVRRFHKAVMKMDNVACYWTSAAVTRYGGIVAPIGFPVHAHRWAEEGPDPIDNMDKPDYDGVNRALRPGLAKILVSLTRHMNGGYEYGLFRDSHAGERIIQCIRYADKYQRSGCTGPIVFVVIEESYETKAEERLPRSLSTMILRRGPGNERATGRRFR